MFSDVAKTPPFVETTGTICPTNIALYLRSLELSVVIGREILKVFLRLNTGGLHKSRATKFCKMATKFCTIVTKFCKMVTKFCKIVTKFCKIANTFLR